MLKTIFISTVFAFTQGFKFTVEEKETVAVATGAGDCIPAGGAKDGLDIPADAFEALYGGPECCDQGLKMPEIGQKAKPDENGHPILTTVVTGFQCVGVPKAPASQPAVPKIETTFPCYEANGSTCKGHPSGTHSDPCPAPRCSKHKPESKPQLQRAATAPKLPAHVYPGQNKPTLQKAASTGHLGCGKTGEMRNYQLQCCSNRGQQINQQQLFRCL